MALDNRRNGRAKPLELAMFPTMGAMAAQTGIPFEILQAANKEGCKFVRHGRCDLLEFIRWYFNRDLSEEEQVNWSKRDKRAAALMKEHNLEKARRSVIDFKEVTRFITDLVANQFFGELNRLAQEYPPTLKGKTELQINEECQRQNEIIKKALQDKLDEWDRKENEEA